MKKYWRQNIGILILVPVKISREIQLRNRRGASINSRNRFASYEYASHQSDGDS